MEIYFIRHTSVDVPPGVCYGQSDVSLTSTFEEEAQLVCKNLNEIKEGFTPESDFDMVFCSPLSRCVKLAEYCSYPNAIRDNRIKEINFGEWELHRFDQIKDPVLQQWYNDYFHVRATGGESFDDQYARVSDFLLGLKIKEKELEQSGQPVRIAVFAHGGVIICGRIFAADISPKEAFDSLTPYGGIVKIEL